MASNIIEQRMREKHQAAKNETAGNTSAVSSTSISDIMRARSRGKSSYPSQPPEGAIRGFTPKTDPLREAAEQMASDRSSADIIGQNQRGAWWAKPSETSDAIAEGAKRLGATAAGVAGNFVKSYGQYPLWLTARAMEVPDDIWYAISKDERFNWDNPQYHPGGRDSDALRATNYDENGQATDPFSAAAEWGQENTGVLGNKVIDVGAAAGNMLAGAGTFGYLTNAANAAGVTSSLANTAASSPLATSAGARTAARLGTELLANPGNLGVSVSSAMSSYDEAIKNGATFDQAVTNGIMKGAAEYLSNKLFSGTPFEDTGEEAGYVTKLIERVANRLGKSEALIAFNGSTGGKIASWIFDKTGEGFEEVVTGIIDPLVDRITYNPEADIATADQLVDEFLGGVLLSLGMTGGEALIRQGARTGADILDSAIQRGRTIEAGRDVRGDETKLGYLLDSAAEMDEQSAAYKMAQEIHAARENGQRVSDASYGTLQTEVENEQTMRDRADLIALAAITSEDENGNVPAEIQRLLDTNPYAARQYAKLKENQAVETGRQETETPAKEPSYTGEIIADNGKYTFRVTDDSGNVMTEQEYATEKEAKTAAADLGYPDIAVKDALPERTALRRDLRARADLDEIGETGQTILLQHADTLGRENISDYYNAFRAYYDAGLTGVDFSDVSIETRIPDRLKQVAFNAGEYDAKYTASEKIAEMPFRGSGLHKADYAYAADEYGVKAADRIRDVAKRLGVEVRFVDLVDGGIANASISGNVVLMEKGNPNPVFKILGHEWTHRMQDLSPETYNEFRDTIKGELDEAVKKIQENYEAHNKKISAEQALDEAVADYAGEMLQNGEILDDFIEATKDKPTFLHRVLDFLQKILDKLDGVERKTVSEAEQKLKAALRAAELAAAQEEGRAPVKADVEVDLSLKNDADYMAAAVKTNSKTGNVSDRVMKQAAKDRATIQKYLQAIADMLPPDIEGNTFYSDSSYGGSEENTTVCVRSLAYEEFMDAVAEELGRPLTVEDTVFIAQEAMALTDKPECLYCYVAMDRKSYREFLGRYLDMRDQFLRDVASGMEVGLEAPKKKGDGSRKLPKNTAYGRMLDGSDNTENMYNRAKLWLESETKITKADLASIASMNKAAQDPALRAQIDDANSYAQSASWAKKKHGYAAYNNHILKWNSRKVAKLNKMYGMRMYSFSDYSPAFILENMQMITDAAVKGLKVLGYTKELDFVRIFAPTGMNINISVFGYNDGNGVAMDAMQGADWEQAQALREEYDNVGCTFVATNDAQVEWALAQDWIDVVIPFHLVRTGANVAKMFGWTNYTDMSADKRTDGKKLQEEDHIYPNEHQNDKATFLELCRKKGLTPRFSKWVDNPGYMKLVNETRQSEGDTSPVQPKFDLTFAKASIDEMVARGGYMQHIGGTSENMRYLAEQMAGKISGTRLSIKTDADYLAAVERWDMDTAQQMVDEAARSAGYITPKLYHGTRAFGFTQFDTSKTDDGISLFATDSPVTAETYSGKTDRRRIYDRVTFDADNLHGEELLAEARKHKKRYNDYRLMTADDKANLIEETRGYIQNSRKMAEDFIADHDGAFNDEKMDIMGRIIAALSRLSKADNEDMIQVAWDDYMDAIWDFKFMDDSLAMELLDDIDDRGLMQDKNTLSDMMYTGDLYGDFYFGGPDYVFDNQLQIEINAATHQGIYELYGMPGRQLVIDADGSNWNQIVAPDELNLYGPQRTRDIAAAAKARGYDSVLFKNLRDNGGETPYNGPSNVYVFFKPNALKSADPITTDGNNEIVPLSERFNPEEKDIRWSMKSDEDYMRLAENPVRNEDAMRSILDETAANAGYTLRLYHGTNQFGWTAPDVSKSDDGISFFATSDVNTAGTYTSGKGVMDIASADKTKRTGGRYMFHDLRFDTQADRDEFASKYPLYHSVEELGEMEDDPGYYDAYSQSQDALREYDTYDAVRTRKTTLRELRDHPERYDRHDLERAIWETSLFDPDDLDEDFDTKPVKQLIDDFFKGLEYVLAEDGRSIDEALDWWFYGRVPEGEDYTIRNRGIYDLYANPDGLLEIDGKDSWWNQIPFRGQKTSTRHIAKIIRDEGEYTGVVFRNIHDNGSGGYYYKAADIYVFFNPEQQVRSADLITRDDNGEIIPPSERFNPQSGDLRFSMKAPVEETKDLVAVHGMTTQNLRDALALGGLPMPSIAIVKSKDGHNRYGEISLVFGKDTIDPQSDSRNKVYGADAWTPTAPQIDYEINDDVARELEEYIEDMSGRIAEGIFKSSSAVRMFDLEHSTNLSVEDAVRNIAGTAAAKAAYLAERGETLEARHTRREFDDYGNGFLQTVVDEFGAKELEQIVINLNDGKWLTDDQTKRLEGLWVQNYVDEQNPRLKAAKGLPFAVAHARKKFSELLRSRIENIMYHAIDYYNVGDSDSIDELATYSDLTKAVNIKDVREWLRPKVEAMYGEPGIRNKRDTFTPMGNRRSFHELHDEYTLENIVKAMKTQQSQRGEGVDDRATPTSLQALAARSYRSVAEIKADSGRLGFVEGEEYQRRIDSVKADIEEVITEIAGDSYHDRMLVSQLLTEAARGRKTVEAITAKFNKDFNISEDTAKRILDVFKEAANLPTEYFEAKPQRAVGFDEVLAAIVPNGTDPELIQELKDAGVGQVLQYRLYDNEDRTKKLNSVKNARFSLKSSDETPTMAQLMRENERLAERVEHFKGQLRITRDWTADSKAVMRLTRKLLKEFDAESQFTAEDRAELAGDIKAIVEYVHRGVNDPDYGNKLKDMIHGVAYQLVRSSRVLSDSSDVQLYNEVRRRLQEPMTIDAMYAHDLSPDKWGDWRRANRGTVNVSINGKGIPVDTAYQELSQAYPWLFPESVSNPADQVMQMIEAVDTLTPVFENPWSGNMAYATDFAVNAILEDVMDDALQAAPTFADRKKAQIQQERKANWEYTQEMLRREREKRDKQIQAIMDFNKESQRRRAERREDSEARTRLLKIARRLQNKKLPAVTRALLDQYIGDLDTVAKSITGSKLEELSALRDWYEKQKATDPDFIADAATEAKIARLSKRRIADMSQAEVAQLTEILLNIENELRNERRIIDSEDTRDTRQMALESIYNIEDSPGSKKGVVDSIVDNTLSPLRLMKRFTGYVDVDPLYRRTVELADGQRKMLDYQMRAERLFSKWTNNEKLIDRLRRDRIKITGLENGRPVTVEITPDMRMALYLHSLNDQNLRHIAKGGITIPDIKLYLKGDLEEAYARGRTVVLTPSNIRAICSKMSEAEKEYAQAASRYFNGMSRDEVNATSEKLVGYSIAGVDNYFPIETDRNFTKAPIDALKRDGTIEGMGFLKERVNAVNAINLVPMMDVLKRSIQNHAKYVGLAIPVRNFGKIWGMAAQNDVAADTRGIRSTLGHKWGAKAVKAVEQMITDLQNGYKRSDDLDKLFGKIRSNYAGAVLSLNLSVALKQAASYPTAAAVLGWKPLAQAMKDVGRVDLDRIAKYTPLQWYRSQGYSTQELGDIKSRQGIVDKALNAKIKINGKDVPLLNWIQSMDLLTTRKLWKASEYYVRDNNKDLKVGSEEYYKAVAEIYNRVIEETQPNYTTMQRPQLLRSQNGLAEILGMFKTQPFQNFNVLYDAVGELRAAERLAKNGDDSRLKTAKKNAANAVSSQIVQLALFAAMTALWGALRKRDDKWRDKSGEMTLGSVLSGIGKDMLSGAASMIPAGSDIYNIFEAIFTGGKYYGTSSVTISAISDAGTAITKAATAIQKEMAKATNGEDISYANLGKAMENLTLECSKAFGVPAENIRNNIQIIMRYALRATDGAYMGDYEYIRLTENMESSYVKGDVYDLLYKAYNNDPKAHKELYNQMVKDGFKPESIKTAMEKRMKEDQGVKSVKDLDKRYNP